MGKKNSSWKSSDLPRTWPLFLPLHELPANSKSRKTYSRRNDSKESKPKTHMAFEPAVPLLGLYILMHVPKDGHRDVFSDVLFVKTKG